MNLNFNYARSWALLNVCLGAALLCGALFFEFIMGLKPCPLCMMQRVWFILAIAVVYVGLLHNPRFGIYPVITLICTIVGGSFSIRQLWLQNLPSSEVPACGPDLAYMLDAFSLSDILIAMTSGTGDCASVAWSFIGISLPGWALVGFIAMFGLAFMQLFRAVR